MGKTAASGGDMRCGWREAWRREAWKGGESGVRGKKETGWCGEGRLTANGCGRLIVPDRGCLWPGAPGDD